MHRAQQNRLYACQVPVWNRMPERHRSSRPGSHQPDKTCHWVRWREAGPVTSWKPSLKIYTYRGVKVPTDHGPSIRSDLRDPAGQLPRAASPTDASFSLGGKINQLPDETALPADPLRQNMILVKKPVNACSASMRSVSVVPAFAIEKRV